MDHKRLPRGVDLGTHNVLGLPIRAVDYDAAISEIVTSALESGPMSVSALAVHGVMTGMLDLEHRFRLRRFSMLVPDGQPVRWALRWLHGVKLPDRVYGPNLMIRCCEAAEKHDISVYLYGSTDETLRDLESKLREQFPRLQIAGAMASRFRQLESDEQNEIVSQIKGSGAQITFVGLGCPRQEVWAFENVAALRMPVLAVGAAFNFHAGNLAQAPRLVQDWGLEWAFRLSREPRRLWRRYVYLNPLFLYGIATQFVVGRDFSAEQQPTEQLRYG